MTKRSWKRRALENAREEARLTSQSWLKRLDAKVTPVHVFFVLGILIIWVYPFAWIDQSYSELDSTLGYLYVAIHLTCYVILSKKLAPQKQMSSAFSAVFIFVKAAVAAIAAAVIVLFLISYALYVNALWGMQEAVTIKGTISESKVWKGSRGSFGCSLQIVYADGKMLKLDYKDLSVCKKYKRGDEYAISMTKGSLGMLYTTRW